MGIPRKKSRPVEIDGRPFRFMVKEVHVPDHDDQAELMVSVQEDDPKPGRVLQFRLPYGFPVGPQGVKAVALQAFKAGWEPHSRGGPFVLEDFRYP